MDELRVFVNGQALRGGSLHHALAGAEFVGPAVTAPYYHFYSVRDEFPGLFPAADGRGVAIAGEVYALDYATLRDRLLPNEPPELELAAIELSDGSGSLCMRLRDGVRTQPGVFDISRYGGWRAYLNAAAKR